MELPDIPDRTIAELRLLTKIQAADGYSMDVDPSGRRRVHCGQQVKQGAFSRTALAHDREQLARGNGKMKIPEELHIPTTRGVNLGESGDADHGLGFWNDMHRTLILEEARSAGEREDNGMNEYESFVAGPVEEVRTRPLRALWHAAHGDWHAAHEEAQAGQGAECAWVHAMLHREEGDQGNAEYWYRRAGKPVSKTSVEQEREQMTATLLRSQI